MSIQKGSIKGEACLLVVAPIIGLAREVSAALVFAFANGILRRRL
jgi:hypothetical protein